MCTAAFTPHGVITGCVNHGGDAIVAAAGVHLSAISVGVQPATFEYVAARITTGTSSCVAVVVYRPGSTPVTTAFYTELADLLDRLSTTADALVLAGDVNIRLERASDPATTEFCDLIAGYGLTQHVTGPTHDAGGTLDVVCTRTDLPTPTVDIIDPGLSDHRLLLWTTSLQRPPPIYSKSTRRAWRLFSLNDFRADLQSSALCDAQCWRGLDGDSLVQLYDDTITQLLDRQVPAETKTCRRRPSNAWFDDECRRAKRQLRSTERATRRAGPISDLNSPAVQAWRLQRRQYFNLLRQKRTDFWTARVTADQQHPHRLWQSLDQLMGRGRAPPSVMNASVHHKFFDDKIAGVRAATAGAAEPTFTAAPVGCELRLFTPVTTLDVTKAIQALPDKQCLTDPLPTWLLKTNVDLLAAFLCQLFNWSLEHGVVPSSMKAAYITPIVKKANMDPTDPKSFRPISNLSVVSKLLERLVCQQLVTYLKTNSLLPDLQSAFRTHHSTETAVLKVMSDILLALDSGNLALLTLLDLSAAFDSVDHATLILRLQKSYGLCDVSLKWITSYLSGRTQYVRTSVTTSKPSTVLFGVPQGSVLGPILFVLYTADVLQLVKDHGLLPHAYADDTQILGVCCPSDTDELQHRVSDCLDAVSSWMAANRLQLNQEKTEALWCSSARRQHQIPTTPVRVGCTSVQPVTAARNLGIYLDGDVSMRTHVTTTVRACFAMLRQIRSVRHSLPRPAMLTMLRSLVINKLDSCSSVMAGAPDVLLHRLQSVLNAAVRLVFSARKFDHTTPLLCELHWLKVPERVKFRLCVLTYRCLTGTAPHYLAETIRPVSSRGTCQHLRSAETSTLLVPSTRRSTLGDRSFSVAAARAWNALPQHVRNASSLPVFRRELKTVLFRSPFPDAI